MRETGGPRSKDVDSGGFHLTSERDKPQTVWCAVAAGVAVAVVVAVTAAAAAAVVVQIAVRCLAVLMTNSVLLADEAKNVHLNMI